MSQHSLVYHFLARRQQAVVISIVIPIVVGFQQNRLCYESYVIVV